MPLDPLLLYYVPKAGADYGSCPKTIYPTNCLILKFHNFNLREDGAPYKVVGLKNLALPTGSSATYHVFACQHI